MTYTFFLYLVLNIAIDGAWTLWLLQHYLHPFLELEKFVEIKATIVVLWPEMSFFDTSGGCCGQNSSLTLPSSLQANAALSLLFDSVTTNSVLFRQDKHSVVAVRERVCCICLERRRESEWAVCLARKQHRTAGALLKKEWAIYGCSFLVRHIFPAILGHNSLQRYQNDISGQKTTIVALILTNFSNSKKGCK